jgi:hypothetical protein
MPTGDDVTVPAPLPALLTVRPYCRSRNSAVTIVAPFTATSQAPVPAQPPPDQPAKIELAAGAAVSTTAAPGGYSSEQSAPQSIPAGLELTVPAPLPDLTISSAW